MERRDFLKASAMSAASAAVLARTVSANAPDALIPPSVSRSAAA